MVATGAPEETNSSEGKSLTNIIDVSSAPLLGILFKVQGCRAVSLKESSYPVKDWEAGSQPALRTSAKAYAKTGPNAWAGHSKTKSPNVPSFPV